MSRPKATVRARGLLTIPAAPADARRRCSRAALRSPLVDRGLPDPQATAYALRDGASGKVRLLIAARVGRASRPVSVGFALSGPGGKVVASRAYEGVAGGDGEWLEFTGEAVVDPATYNLRLAVVDAGGRRGSVEHTVKAALVSAGGLEISDLVLAPASAGRGGAPGASTWSSRAAGSRPSWRWPAAIRPASPARRSPSSWRSRRTAPPLLRAPVVGRGGGEGRDARGPHRDRRRAAPARRLHRPRGGLPRGQAGGGRHAAVPHRPAAGRDAPSPAPRSPACSSRPDPSTGPSS